MNQSLVLAAPAASSCQLVFAVGGRGARRLALGVGNGSVSEVRCWGPLLCWGTCLPTCESLGVLGARDTGASRQGFATLLSVSLTLMVHAALTNSINTNAIHCNVIITIVFFLYFIFSTTIYPLQTLFHLHPTPRNHHTAV